MVEEAIKIAGEIAEKSPVGVQGTKRSLIYSRDHSVQEGLDHIVSITLLFLKTSFHLVHLKKILVAK